MSDLSSPSLAARRAGRAAWLLPTGGVSVLQCRAGGRDLCVEAGSVLEARACVGLLTMPGVAPPVLGLTVVRGAAVPVFDLARALGLPAGLVPDDAGAGPGLAAGPVLLVLRDGPRWAGALVDAVGGVLALPAAAWRAGAAWSGLPAPGLLRGEAWHEGQRLWLLEATALMRAPSTGLTASVEPC